MLASAIRPEAIHIVIRRRRILGWGGQSQHCFVSMAADGFQPGIVAPGAIAVPAFQP